MNENGIILNHRCAYTQSIIYEKRGNSMIEKEKLNQMDKKNLRKKGWQFFMMVIFIQAIILAILFILNF